MISTNIYILFLIFNYVNGNLFSSVASVESVLETQQSVILSVESALKDTVKFLEDLNEYHDMLKEDYENAIKDKESYLGNAINVFRLFRSLYYDLNEIREKQLNLSTSFDERLLKDNQTYPDEQEIEGVVTAFSRLRATYNLDLEDIADGIIYNKSYAKPLTSVDCLILAKQHYDLGDNYSAIKWAEIAIKKTDPIDSEKIKTAYGVLAKVYEALNDKVNAMKIYDKFIGDEPENPEPLSIKADFLRRWNRRIADNEDLRNKTDEAINFRQDRIIGKNWDAFQYYEELCRGSEVYPPPYIGKNLKCYYHKGRSSFLKFAPVKAEMLSIDPELIKFYDVISEDEMNHIIELGKPQLERSQVRGDDGNPIPSIRRISANAWLYDEDRKIDILNQRIEDLTDMSLESSENYQVVNYGVGGYYIYHTDYSDKPIDGGFRLATFLLYLSDVELGGSTVFTKLGIAVPPRKGTAVFWRNLLPSMLEGDERTWHGSCPVLNGNKWIATKWLWTMEQELRQPCIESMHL